VRGGAHEYDVALSFSGESRGLASGISRALGPGYAVFLDTDEATRFWGAELLQELPQRYLDARLCVMLVTDRYLERFWPGFERATIVDEILGEDRERVLCVRLPGCTAPLPTPLAPIAIDVPAEPEHIADLVRTRLQPDVSRGTPSAG
jgi:hypothetical protein